VNNHEIDRKVRAAQASITSLSIFVVLSVAMIGLLVSPAPVTFGYNATVVSSVFLMLAIVSFLIALEFFILCIYHCKHIDWFGFRASCLYGFGAMCMVVGISVSLLAFGIRALSIVFLSAASVGYLGYYTVRIWKLGREDPFKTRMLFRGVSLLLLVIGFVFVTTLGGE